MNRDAGAPGPRGCAEVLENVIEYSKPFGTLIEIENGVGIIRMAEDNG